MPNGEFICQTMLFLMCRHIVLTCKRMYWFIDINMCMGSVWVCTGVYLERHFGSIKAWYILQDESRAGQKEHTDRTTAIRRPCGMAGEGDPVRTPPSSSLPPNPTYLPTPMLVPWTPPSVAKTRFIHTMAALKASRSTSGSRLTVRWSVAGHNNRMACTQCHRCSTACWEVPSAC